jgi:hypothetical protein
MVVTFDVVALMWNTMQICAATPFVSAGELQKDSLNDSRPPFTWTVADAYEQVVVPSVVALIVQKRGRGR